MSQWEHEDQDEATHVYQPGFGAPRASYRAAQAQAELGADRWFISRDGRAKEVLTAREIIESTQAGVLSEEALVWRDGLTDWTPLGQVPELMRAVHAFVAPSGGLPPPPVVPRMVSRPVVNRTLPPMPSLPPLAGLPPVPSVPPPPAPLSARYPGQTSQPVMVGTGPAERAGGLRWSRPVELPGLGATPLRVLALMGGVLIGGVALGALMFSGQRSPKPLVISGDVGSAREVAATPQMRGAAAPVFAPAGNGAGVEPGSLPVAAGEPRGNSEAVAPPRAATPEPAVARAASPEPERAASPEPERAASPEPARVSQPARAAFVAPEPERAAPEPAPAVASEPEKPLDPLVEAMRQRVKPAAEAPASEDAPEPEAKSAKASGGDFNLEATKAALASAAARAAKCQPKGGPTGTGSVRVTLSPSGSVSAVSIQTAKFDGTATGSCVQLVFRQVKVPPFSGGEKSVAKKFTIP
jgi:GYF domain 2